MLNKAFLMTRCKIRLRIMSKLTVICVFNLVFRHIQIIAAMISPVCQQWWSSQALAKYRGHTLAIDN